MDLKPIRGGDIHDLVEFGDETEIYYVEMLYYRKDVVDSLLAEKNAEIARLNDKALQYKVLDNEHCRDLNTQEKFFAEEIRRLRRALWLAHAYKVKFKRWWLHLALDCEAREIHPDTKTINRIKGKIGNCEKSECKCRAMAKRYEEKSND